MAHNGKITIWKYTTDKPLDMIGELTGVCWNSPIDDSSKNIQRAMDCLESGHGRTMEFPDIYLTIDGYSARVMREWYTHIGGAPTRLQASTRYIDYKEFDYYIPEKIIKNEKAFEIYINVMKYISNACVELEELGIPREDIANILPLGMLTKIVDKRDIRNVIDMSRQRMCNRAYHEYRMLFEQYLDALSNYSDEWKTLISMTMMPKCKMLGYCPEKKSCGKMPKKNK